jgi:Domain of unknown function (DUF1937)
MQQRLVYLASPYTSADPAVRQARFEAACRAAAELIRQGLTICSPIAHSHAICQHGAVPLDWAFWRQHDLTFLAMCDEVVVLKLVGWRQSVGVQAEIAAAKSLGKPVSFLDLADVAAGHCGSSEE